MNATLRKLGLFTALIIGTIGAAQATPVTYNFTATDFQGFNIGAVPNNPLSGDVTIDGASITDIHLTIGSHTYNTAEVGYVPGLVGGVLGCDSGANCIQWGTDDFWLQGDFSGTPTFFDVYYSVSGIDNLFYTNTGTLSIANNVPEPVSIALLGLGLLGLGVSRRKKA